MLMHAIAHGGSTDTARESASAPRASYDAKNDVCVLFVRVLATCETNNKSV